MPVSPLTLEERNLTDFTVAVPFVAGPDSYHLWVSTSSENRHDFARILNFMNVDTAGKVVMKVIEGEHHLTLAHEIIVKVTEVTGKFVTDLDASPALRIQAPARTDDNPKVGEGVYGRGTRVMLMAWDAQTREAVPVAAELNDDGTFSLEVNVEALSTITPGTPIHLNGTATTMLVEIPIPSPGFTKRFSIVNKQKQILRVSFDGGVKFMELKKNHGYGEVMKITKFHIQTFAGTTDYQSVAIV